MSPTHTTGRKSKKKAISPEARKLILATVRRAGSYRKAARVLRLPSHAQLAAMLEGRIGETTAMKAAVLRARARAQRAFLLEPVGASPVDVEQLRRMVREAKWVIDVLDNFLR